MNIAQFLSQADPATLRSLTPSSAVADGDGHSHPVTDATLRLAYEACLLAHEHGRALPCSAVSAMLDAAFAVQKLARFAGCAHPLQRAVFRLAPAAASEFGCTLESIFPVPQARLVSLAAGLGAAVAEARRFRIADAVGPVRREAAEAKRAQAERTVAPVIFEARRIIAALGIDDIAIIGGNRVAEAERTLSEGLACSVRWIGTDKHDTCRTLVAPVAKADLLLSATNFARHRTTGMLNAFSRTSGVPLVRLGKGYGVAGVSAAIVAQLGSRVP